MDIDRLLNFANLGKKVRQYTMKNWLFFAFILAMCALVTERVAAESTPSEILEKSVEIVTQAGEKIEVTTSKQVIEATRKAISKVQDVESKFLDGRYDASRVVRELNAVRTILSKVEKGAPSVFEIRLNASSDIEKVGQLIGFKEKDELALISSEQQEIERLKSQLPNLSGSDKRKVEARIRTSRTLIEAAEARNTIWRKFLEKFRIVSREIGSQDQVLDEFVFMVGQTNIRLTAVVETAELQLEAERIISELEDFAELRELSSELDNLSGNISSIIQTIAELRI